MASFVRKKNALSNISTASTFKRFCNFIYMLLCVYLLLLLDIILLTHNIIGAYGSRGQPAFLLSKIFLFVCQSRPHFVLYVLKVELHAVLELRSSFCVLPLGCSSPCMLVTPERGEIKKLGKV
ncbi:hypothetical protein AB205_0092430 [Aquarana catesbeiana]|uniref:Uncharacterized protein n=1 Tax=Aquarana catesbeiana TaxID=8400 RepID=A0A2G9SHP3_AQUCT|nr:hypothetical protein AB205_0092430 [Aquarana catesbeiana]